MVFPFENEKCKIRKLNFVETKESSSSFKLCWLKLYFVKHANHHHIFHSIHTSICLTKNNRFDTHDKIQKTVLSEMCSRGEGGIVNIFRRNAGNGF